LSAEIRRLCPAGPIAEPDQTIIDKLRELLAEAERGEIKGFGVFYVLGNDAIGTGWTPGCADSFQMVAGAAKLFHRVVAADTKE
jgi:hypothetical protein